MAAKTLYVLTVLAPPPTRLGSIFPTLNPRSAFAFVVLVFRAELSSFSPKYGKRMNPINEVRTVGTYTASIPISHNQPPLPLSPRPPPSSVLSPQTLADNHPSQLPTLHQQRGLPTPPTGANCAGTAIQTTNLLYDSDTDAETLFLKI